MTTLLIAQIFLTLFVFVMLLSSAAVMVYVERKVAAVLQQRLGPYLVGPRGVLQPLADIVKLLFKEELKPGANVHVHINELDYIDHACLDLLSNWDRQHAATGGSLTIEWDELSKKYHQRRLSNMKAARQAAAAAKA